MIWGLGTGRCGTKSLAAEMGGLHEPKPGLFGEAILAHYGNTVAREITLARLVERSLMDTPIVVDQKHSWCIPLIRTVDACPEFVWMVRNPVACVASLVSGTAFSRSDAFGVRKWHPEGFWPDWMTRTEKAAAYWLGVNKLLLAEWSSRPEGEVWTIRRTESLTAHENGYPGREDRQMPAADAAMVMDLCGSLWQTVRDLIGEPVPEPAR